MFVEITTSTQEQIAESWPSVTYKGDKKFFDNYIGWQEEIAKRLEVDDYQECYLGYDPGDDSFVMGFDVWNYGWYGDSFSSQMVKFSVEGAKVTKVHDQESFDYGFYPGHYEKLKADNPNLIDLRLD